MEYLDKLEESMKVLDLLSSFLMEGSENYVVADDIREHIKDVFIKIRDIYEYLEKDPLIQELEDNQD
jgi:hypothetical protein